MKRKTRKVTRQASEKKAEESKEAPPSKKALTQELKRVYHDIGKPFTQDEYDLYSSEELDSQTVVEVFGTWAKALSSAGLAKRFNIHIKTMNEMEVYKPEKELEKEWNNEKKKLLANAEKKRISQLKKQHHATNMLKEMIETTFAKIEPLVVTVEKPRKTKPVSKKTKPKGTLWFEFSDLQLGTFITEEEMGGINHHNWDIWKEKLNVWRDQVIEKVAFYKRVYEVDRVVVACLGDMVEGQDIFKGQKWSLDQHVVDQALMGAQDTAEAFAKIFLAHTDLEFHVLEVFGNHGRVGSKGESPYSCSMDKVYQRFLEARLEDAVPNMTYHHNEKWFAFIDVYGWKHLLLHGDQGMSKIWSNRPTVNGLEKGMARYNQMFQNNIHFLHCGHFHNDWQLSFNYSQILINGSFIGTSMFSATVMTACSPAIQVMHVFEPRIGLAKTERIHLTTGDVRKPVKAKKL